MIQAIKCLFGFHNWSKWVQYRDGKQGRRCDKCGEREEKPI